jgi:succinyl-diaminopimelate desuccinylase
MESARAVTDLPLPPETTIARVFAEIDRREAELAELTADLIRFETVNPPGRDYGPCAEFIGERLRAKGFAIDYVRAKGEPGDSHDFPRLNVIARHIGAAPGPCVHFNGHIDVVEAGQGWTVDPFGGLIRDGRVYGRGACDMKGGIAAAMIAVEAIIAAGVPYRGALELSGTADEESGGFGGVGYLARNGWFSPPKVDHVIIPEPLNPDRVCLGHRGVWWAEIEMRGRIGHGSMPFLGVSAIRGMADFMGRVEQKLYPQLDARRTAMNCVPPGARASTLNYNSIHGGQPEPEDGLPSPVVADWCRLVIDRRYLIEEPLEAVKGEIIALLDEAKAARAGLDYSVRELMQFAPVMTDAADPVVRALDHWIETLFARPAEHIASPGTYDQKHIQRFGALRSCVAYGPGILDLAHQPDEWVGIADMLRSAKVMAAAALTLTGVADG